MKPNTGRNIALTNLILLDSKAHVDDDSAFHSVKINCLFFSPRGTERVLIRTGYLCAERAT